jgi:hypothetical protein
MSCFDNPNPACGIPQQPMHGVDRLRVDADNIARELFSPDPRMHGQAMDHIRQEVFNLDPRGAEIFTRDLQQATGGRSPLREQPEMGRDNYGRPFQTGNDVLVMNDPYRGSEVLKQIPHMPPPGYGQPPVVIERRDPAAEIVGGVAAGVGAALIFDALGHHRR